MALTDMQAIGVFALLDEKKKLEEERDALLIVRDALLASIEHKDSAYDACTAERDALRAVLREIAKDVRDRERFGSPAHLVVFGRELFERAEKLLAPDEIFAACTCDGVNECDACKTMRSAK